MPRTALTDTIQLSDAQYIERTLANTADALRDLILQLTGQKENRIPDCADLIALSKTDAKKLARILSPILTNVQNVQYRALSMTDDSKATRVELTHWQRINIQK